MFYPPYFISLSPFTPSLNHCEHQRSRFEGSTRRQELSTHEALRQVPSPIRSCIARLCRSTTSMPTPPRTRDEILYHEESSPRGLPTTTIPHDGMKRRQVAESESVPDSPPSGRHLKAQMTAHHRDSRWPALFTSSQPYSR